MKPFNYISSRFAGFDGAKVSCYYGANEDDPGEEWCAVIFKNGKEVARYTNSELLEVAGQESPSGLIIAALSLYLNK